MSLVSNELINMNNLVLINQPIQLFIFNKSKIINGDSKLFGFEATITITVFVVESTVNLKVN